MARTCRLCYETTLDCEGRGGPRVSGGAYGQLLCHHGLRGEDGLPVQPAACPESEQDLRKHHQAGRYRGRSCLHTGGRNHSLHGHRQADVRQSARGGSGDCGSFHLECECNLRARHSSCIAATTNDRMAENNFSFPFDLNHLSILKYEHLGKDIGFDEVMRFRGILKEKIGVLMGSPEVDSPVFLFIPTLKPASLPAAGAAAMPEAAAPQPAPSSRPTDSTSFAELLEKFRAAKRDAKKAADWAMPLELLGRLKTMQPNDPYILQQLALATYKHERPDKKVSLIQAKIILGDLAPQTSSDAETVGLWGAIHKRLWEELKNNDDLDEAVRAYARGYYIKTDYNNGINYAFMLNVRAASTAGDEAFADRILARRIRQQVLVICD